MHCMHACSRSSLGGLQDTASSGYRTQASARLLHSCCCQEELKIKTEQCSNNCTCGNVSGFFALQAVDSSCCLVQPMPTPTGHEAPMMCGPSPSPILPTGPKDNKQWKCIQCDETFPQSKSLETHAVETDHKAYRCTKEKPCGKLFILRPSWIWHERSHSAQKTHACSRCGKKFHRKDNCHDHERTCGRVARRARGSSQSASTSPATSGTTESGTPIDPPATIFHGAESGHATKTEYEGSKSFETPDATIQEDNGHEDDNAPQSVSRGLSVPTKSPPAFPAAYLSAMATVPTQSRTAAFQARTAAHPPEAEQATLLNLDTTDKATISRNITSQPHADSDWRQWFRSFQSPGAAPSPNLQHAEDPCDIIPVRDAYATRSAPVFDIPDQALYEDFRAMGNARVHWGCNYYDDSYDRPIFADIRTSGDATSHMGFSYRDDDRSSDRSAWSNIPARGHAVVHGGIPYDHDYYTHSRPRMSIRTAISGPPLDPPVLMRHPYISLIPRACVLPSRDLLRVPARQSLSNSKDTNEPPSSEPKPEPTTHNTPPPEPESAPPSKINIFFSMLKEHIKAPFRGYKQWQHGW